MIETFYTAHTFSQSTLIPTVPNAFHVLQFQFCNRQDYKMRKIKFKLCNNTYPWIRRWYKSCNSAWLHVDKKKICFKIHKGSLNENYTCIYGYISFQHFFNYMSMNVCIFTKSVCTKVMKKQKNVCNYL